jgi:2'-5' RNA ligase
MMVTDRSDEATDLDEDLQEQQQRLQLGHDAVTLSGHITPTGRWVVVCSARRHGAEWDEARVDRYELLSSHEALDVMASWLERVF